MTQKGETAGSSKPRKRVTSSRRDWTGLLVPILATIFMSVGAQILTGIWQSATFKAQVNQMDETQKKQGEAIAANSAALQAVLTRLPIDYMPRKEIEENRERNKEARDIENSRLDKLDSKIDMILSNQQRR